MKIPVKTLLLLLALIITRPAARAADQDVSILPGFNYIGAHVVNAPHGSAAVLGVSGNTITFKTPGWLAVAPLLGAGVKFTVEHPTSGHWDIVTACSGKVVTVSSPWPYGPNPADKPIIRRVKTISQLFGTQTKPGTGFTGSKGTPQNPGPAGAADRIWVPNGSGTGYNVYWRGTGGNWRCLWDSATHPSDPIYFIQGMIYERMDSAQLMLTFTGEAITGQKEVHLGEWTSARSMLTSLGTNSSGAGSDLVSSLFGISNPFVSAKTLGNCGVLPFAAGTDTIRTGPYICSFNGLNWEDAYGNDASNFLLTSGFICDRAYWKVTMTLTP